MKQRTIASIAALIVAAACTQNDHAVNGPAAPMPLSALQITSGLPPALQTFKPRVLSAAESAIIDTLAAINPAGAEITRRLLSDKRVASITLPDVRSQELLKRLDSVRLAAFKAAFAAQAASDISASLVLVDHLDDTTATAVVVRRAGPHAKDLILLPVATATGTHLSTALGTLFALRKRLGDVPSQNLRIAIHGLKQPTKWSPDLVSQADQIVRVLKTDTVTSIPGIGRGRVTSIPLMPSKTLAP
jgi:hypothetical protein